MRRCWFLAIILLLTGCAHHKGGSEIKFLLPWSTDDGHYSLQEVTLSTLSSPNELRGEAAEIYYQSGMSGTGFSGPIAHPHVMRSGDIYVPMDAQSSLAVTVYAEFERLFQFEKKIGTSGQITWARRVGVELNMVGPDGSAHNNAHYMGNLDVIGLLPYTLVHVPVAINKALWLMSIFIRIFKVRF